MSKTNPPFRADHVGSLLRPKPLLDMRARYHSGDITAEELRAAEDEAIRDAVKKQESVGLQSITDGEFRRTYFHLDFLEQVGLPPIQMRNRPKMALLLLGWPSPASYGTRRTSR
jgi:5-methyltetrahydropteroyltriglutamate--homocysteine methyltransferase